MDHAEREKKALAELTSNPRGALQALYEIHARVLFRSVLMPMLKDRAAAEDALRDTFLSALDRAASFSGDAALPWLVTIARNKALDAMRSRGARDRLSHSVAADPPEPVSDPEDVVGTVERREQARARIEDVLSEIHPRYAQALRLRLLEDRERNECAERMGISLGNFDVVFFRACKAFRTRYVQRFGEEP